MNMGNCPKCKMFVQAVNMEAITINASPQTWKGVSFVCPSCSSVLGVGFDPAALAQAVAEALEARQRPQ